MTVAYATAVELAGFNSALTGLEDADRKLQRASERLDDVVRRPFAVDAGQLPTDADIKATMRDACCAQVEFWELGPGEEHDIEGMANRGVSIGHLRVDALPPDLAPRAFRILHIGGMLSPSDINTTAARAGAASWV